MTTAGENERLAVLESQYNNLQGDVTEIKSDVKALVFTQSTLATNLAVRDAAAMAEMKSRSSTGTWIRSFLPMVVSLLALFIALIDRIGKG